MFIQPSYNSALLSKLENGPSSIDLQKSEKAIVGWRLGSTIEYKFGENHFLQSGVHLANLGFTRVPDASWNPFATKYTQRNYFIEVPTAFGWKVRSPLSEHTSIHVGLLHQLLVHNDRDSKLLAQYQLGIVGGINYYYSINERTYWYLGPALYFAATNSYNKTTVLKRYPYTVGINIGLSAGW